MPILQNGDSHQGHALPALHVATAGGVAEIPAIGHSEARRKTERRELRAEGASLSVAAGARVAGSAFSHSKFLHRVEDIRRSRVDLTPLSASRSGKQNAEPRIARTDY